MDPGPNYLNSGNYLIEKCVRFSLVINISFFHAIHNVRLLYQTSNVQIFPSQHIQLISNIYLN